MLTQRRLSLEEAERAVKLVYEEARRDRQPMAVAVMDNHGELISCARMDGAAPRILRHAIRKAHTAAVMARDTSSFRKDLEQRGGSLDQWGDQRLTTLAGGAVVLIEGEVVGAVAVGGNIPERDDAIAHLAIKAMQL